MFFSHERVRNIGSAYVHNSTSDHRSSIIKQRNKKNYRFTHRVPSGREGSIERMMRWVVVGVKIKRGFRTTESGGGGLTVPWATSRCARKQEQQHRHQHRHSRSNAVRQRREIQWPLAMLSITPNSTSMCFYYLYVPSLPASIM